MPRGVFGRFSSLWIGGALLAIHEYGEIDRRRVYQYLLEKLELFKAFKKEILNWLKN